MSASTAASAFSAALPPQALMTARPMTAPGAVAHASKDQLKALAGKFESSFIASMLEPMFSSLSTSGPFGGGQGEAAFRSFLVDAVAKKMTASGGLGLSKTLQSEFLKMQGAS